MRSRLVAALAVLVLALSACGGGDDTAEGKSDDKPSFGLETGSLGTKEADALAVEMASRAVTLWARPDLSVEEWTAELRPALSDVGMSVLSFVDPTTIKKASLTGKGRVMAGSKSRVVVSVGTSVGDYRVTMSRASESQPWLVDRVAAPVGG